MMTDGLAKYLETHACAGAGELELRLIEYEKVAEKLKIGYGVGTFHGFKSGPKNGAGFAAPLEGEPDTISVCRRPWLDTTMSCLRR